MSFQKAGDLTRALEYAQKSLRLFETLQDVRMAAQLRNNMAEIMLSQGRNEEAEALFIAGAEQLRRVGDKDLVPHLIAGAAEAALKRDDRELAERRIARALELTAESHDATAELAARRVAGRIAVAEGDGAKVREHFDRALALATLARQRNRYRESRLRLRASARGPGRPDKCPDPPHAGVPGKAGGQTLPIWPFRARFRGLSTMELRTRHDALMKRDRSFSGLPPI